MGPDIKREEIYTAFSGCDIHAYNQNNVLIGKVRALRIREVRGIVKKFTGAIMFDTVEQAFATADRLKIVLTCSIIDGKTLQKTIIGVRISSGTATRKDELVSFTAMNISKWKEITKETNNESK